MGVATRDIAIRNRAEQNNQPNGVAVSVMRSLLSRFGQRSLDLASLASCLVYRASTRLV